MFNEPSNPFDDDQVPNIPDEWLGKTPEAQHRDDFAKFDVRELSNMDAKALRLWQRQFKPEEPQWKLAEDEMQKRLTRPTRIIAFLALIISALSLALSAWGYWHPHR